VILDKRDQLAEAVEELKRCTALDPTYPEPWYALGRVYQRQGDTQNAAHALREFQKLKKQQRPEQPLREETAER
jgi:Flp pilus assembly protein TadD